MTLPKDTLLDNSKYKILAPLSKGGFGITYIAIRISDGHRVCIKEFFISAICKRDNSGIKVVPLTDSCRETFIDFKSRFLKEANTLRHLSHPGIVRVEDIFEENNTAYYVMEYVDGQSLLAIIPPGGISAKEAQGIILQLASAVDYIHQRKISHLDIKPANILVGSNNRLVLIDFGGAKRYNEYGEQTSSSPITVSEGYAPLELYSEIGLNEFSPTTDIYEIGATLYHLVTGKKPPCASEVMENGLVLDNALPRNIAQTILLAMHPDRKRRLQSIADFRKTLNNSLSDTTIIETASDSSTIYDPLVDTYSDSATIYDPISSSGDPTVINASSATEIETIYNGQNMANDSRTTYPSKETRTLDEIRGVTKKNNRFYKNPLIIACIAAFIIVVVLIIINVNKSDDYTIEDPYDYEYVEDELAEELSEEEIAECDLQNLVNNENAKVHNFQKGLVRLDSLSLNDKCMTFYFCMSKDAATIYNELRYNKNARKNYMITDIKHNALIYDIAQKLILLGRKMTFKFYMQSNPSRKIDITLTPKELAAITPYDDTKENKNKNMMEEMANNVSKQCPQTIEPGLVMQKCEFNGSEIIYFYTCSNENYEYINQSLPEIKNDIASQFHNDRALKSLVDICAKEGVDITYIYKRKSTPGEIKITYNCQTKSFM